MNKKVKSNKLVKPVLSEWEKQKRRQLEIIIDENGNKWKRCGNYGENIWAKIS